MQKGEESKLRNYIRALPAAIPTPLHWTQQQLDLLQYQPLVQEVEEQRESWNKLYESYCKSCSDRQAIAPIEMFVHEIECVRSRTFSGPYEGSNWDTRVKQYGLVLVLAVGYVLGGFGEVYQAINGALTVFLFTLFRDLIQQRNPRSIRYVLCPVLDMFNHNATVESNASYEYFRNTFTLTVNSGVSENEEVFISYGKRGNDELMQYYGFVVPDNLADSYVMCNFVDKAVYTARGGGFCSDDEDEDTFAKRVGMLKDDRVVVRPKLRGLTDRCLQTLRVLVASKEELKGRAALLDFSSKVSDDNEAKAYKLMCGVCERELSESLPTTLEEDQTMLNNLLTAKKKFLDEELNETGVKIQALQFRIAKKQVLKTFMKLNNQ